jgi:hypothetical protein
MINLTEIQCKIFNILKEKGSLSRNQICELFDFKMNLEYNYNQITYAQPHFAVPKYKVNLKQYEKRTTVYDNLRKLQKHKLVEKITQKNGKRGRPLVLWKLTKFGEAYDN